METNESLVEVLNDLIKINNDRINGYQKAVSEITAIDVDLQALFRKMANESREYVSELNNAVEKLGGEPVTDTTVSGKIYRTWMEIKATFASNERLSILEACEFGEDAAQKAYDEALGSDAEINAETRQMIMDQKSSLRTSHNIIKKYRDLHETLAS